MSTDVSASAKLISSTSRKLSKVWCWFHQKPARLVGDLANVALAAAVEGDWGCGLLLFLLGFLVTSG